jgi:alpha-tubulin suppressor-like RCC1 family protein
MLSGVTAIAAGGVRGFEFVAPPYSHTVALREDGTVIAWGHNFSGQVTGTPTTDDHPDYAPVTPVTLGGQVLSGAKAIAAGRAHTVALKNDGTVMAWGENSSGQVTGTPTTNAPYSATAIPVRLGGEVLSRVTAIAGGGGHTVALKDDGSVVAWGENDWGQATGSPSTDAPYSGTATPVTLGGRVLSGVIAVAAGDSHTVALKDDATVIAWGSNLRGQVTGTPTPDEPYSLAANPVTLGGQVLSGVTAIAAGRAHTVALNNDGTVVAWGENYWGQATGAPSTEEPYSGTATPVTLGGQVLSGVTAIAAGDAHTVAVKNDGSVIAWGYNLYGQATGTPTTTDWPFFGIAGPVTLGGQVVSGVTAIAAGGFHTVALIGTVRLLPSLNATPNGSELILSWPTKAVGFTLQSTLDLTAPVTWLDSTSVPTVIGARFTLTNATPGSAQFYRLGRK